MATTVTLNPSLGIATLTNASRVYSLVALPESPDGRTVGSLRTNQAATMGSPERFLIQHQYVPGKNGGLAVDRHVVRVEKTKAASGDYPEEMLSINLTITCPRGRTTAAEAKDAVGEIVDFVNDLTVLTRLLNSDVIAEP